MISFRAIKLYLGIILGTVVLVTFLTAVGNDFVDWDDYAFVDYKLPYTVHFNGFFALDVDHFLPGGMAPLDLVFPRS